MTTSVNISGVMSDDLLLAVRAAREAGQYIRKKFRSHPAVELKPGNQSPVTEVDRNAEKLIVDLLSEESKYGIVGEEGAQRNSGDNNYWIIDPIDGTSNYIHNVPFFGVSIALIKTGEIQAGVVYDPISENCYFAEKGSGAYLNNEPILVNGDDSLPPLILIEHGRSDDSRSRYAELVKRVSREHTMRKYGSTALELCFVATGQADAFLSTGGHFWDFAAGLILVTEAGGSVTDWQGNDWNGSHSFILASNGNSQEMCVSYASTLQPDKIPEEEQKRFSHSTP